MLSPALPDQLVLHIEVQILRTAIAEHVHCRYRYGNGAVEHSCGWPGGRPCWGGDSASLVALAGAGSARRAGQYLHEARAILNEVHMMHRSIIRGSCLDRHQAGDSCAFNWRDHIRERRDVVAVDRSEEHTSELQSPMYLV